MTERSRFELTRENLKIVAVVAVTAVAAFTVGRWVEKVSVAKSLLNVIL